MKKYYVGGSTAGVVIGIIMCLVPVLPVVLLSSIGAPVGAIIPFSLFFAVWIGFGIYVCARSFLGLKRKNIALQGRKAYGTVKDSYYSGGENSTYVLRVEYKTENGEDAEFTANPGARYSQYFQVGKRIPIFVNGDYAYFDEEGVTQKAYEEAYEDEAEETSKFITCDCGYKFENGLLYCPKCGKAVSEMHKGCKDNAHKNFCPACGSPVDPDARFCTNCGYKL